MLVVLFTKREKYGSVMHSLFRLQACGNIEKHFQSEIVEPQLIVFFEENTIVQQFDIAERKALMEVSSTTVCTLVKNAEL